MEAGQLMGCMILKFPICLIKGHDINPDESIVNDLMIDKRNWLCRCKRCGLYVMHDGAISGLSVTLTRRGAMNIKRDFEREMLMLRMQIKSAKEVTKDERFNRQTSGN